MTTTYKIYKVTADDDFVMYTVVDAANDMIIETFYTNIFITIFGHDYIFIGFFFA